MKDVLELIVKSLVNNPDSVQITENTTDYSIELKVKVAKEDMGKVIGKQGRIAKAIRTVMKSLAFNEKKKVDIEFLD
ncbi:MAG: KH domain-containing protein [Clostridia bacterium]|nr:KH domain-containing protein [Clostridia bacterium]